MTLKGKVALITGGAVRIGAAICRALAAESASVVIHFRRSKSEAVALAKGIGGLVVQSDLNSEAACERLVEQSVRKAGRLDILVNNAAVFHQNSLRTLSGQKLLDEFWPNLFAPILLMRAFAAQARRGKIVNLLDRRIASLDTSSVPYVLTKKALAEATRMAALELAPGITVNGVAPGAILPPPGKGMKYLHDKAGPVPLKRQVTPEEIAKAVVFLLQSDSVTGQIVFVDGGQNLMGAL
jgi:pteridine reductase